MNFNRSHIPLIFYFAISPGLTSAMSITDFKKMEKQSIAYSIEKNYKAAFRTAQEFIEKAEAEGESYMAMKGYHFLKERELIANEAFTHVNFVNINSDVCKNGASETLEKFEKYLHSNMADVVEPEILQQKTDLINKIRDLLKDTGVDACMQLTPYAIAEENRMSNQAAIDEKERKRIYDLNAKEAKIRLKEMGFTEFCEVYGNFIRNEKNYFLSLRDSQIREEIVRRKITVDKTMIKTGSVRIGSSECQVYASYGKPDRINRTVSIYGENKQLVFEQGSSRSIYIYLKNGRISSFQD